MDNRNELFYRISKLREERYKEKELGSIGKFYKETAEGYQKRTEEASAQYSYWADIWEDRFARAEQEYSKWASRKEKNKGGYIPQPMFNAYADGKTWSKDNRRLDLFKILDEQGRRRSYEEMERLSAGNSSSQQFVRTEIQNLLQNKTNLDDLSSTYETYNQRYQDELSALTKENEEAKAKFLEDKQRQLAAAEGTTAYRGPTYQEKPL